MKTVRLSNGDMPNYSKALSPERLDCLQNLMNSNKVTKGQRTALAHIMHQYKSLLTRVHMLEYFDEKE